MIVCAGKSEQFSFAQPVGIGMIESAINLSRICEIKKPDYIIFVGTAGSYGEKEIFEIVESRTAANIEQAFFTQDAYTPIDNMVSAYGGTEGDAPLVATLLAQSSLTSFKGAHVSRETLESREAIVNTSNYITTNKEIWKYYTAQSIHLENMEFFAVLKVAQMYGISAVGIFIVTNYCDENAHEDFLKNHKEAMQRLDLYVKARVGK